MRQPMTFLDLLAGIGGFRLGMESAGHKCVGFCEIDKYATQSYRAIYNTEGEWCASDIREVEAKEMPEADCWCFGFPCQPFSIAGARRGLGDERGDLVFRVLKLAKRKRPPLLFCENVRGLLSQSNCKAFISIVLEFWDAGYDLQWQVINSKYFVPQRRERVYIVGHLRGMPRPKIFPLLESAGKDNELRAEQINASTITTSCVRTNREGNYVVEGFKSPINLNKGVSAGDRVWDSCGIVPTLNAGGGRARDPMIIQRPRGKNRGGDHSIAPTINRCGYEQNNLLSDGAIIRRLTPLECWRLQGFPDWAFDGAKASGVSDNQLYKQAGNSVTVPVITAIAKRLIIQTKEKRDDTRISASGN